MVPVINPVRLGPTSSGGMGDWRLIWSEPILLRQGIVAALFVDVLGKVRKRCQRMPVVRGTAVLRGSGV
eukprot:2072415-Amphidinium_carterae.1